MTKVEPAATQRRSRRRSDESPRLTSMIDVIFLLLVYFVTTASFAQHEGVIVGKMPQGVTKDDKPGTIQMQRDIVVNVRSAGHDPTGYVLSVQGNPQQPANFRELAQVLERMQGVIFTKDDKVVIETDGQVRWQHAVNAFNAALAAGYTNVRFESERND